MRDQVFFLKKERKIGIGRLPQLRCQMCNNEQNIIEILFIKHIILLKR